jgi:adenosylmethionine---8-amino-7-oxononanoate aminotransferase
MTDLNAIDKKNIWHPYTPLNGAPEPILIESAQGIYLRTPDGKTIMDAVSSWWVNLHGHSHPVLAKALADQALKLEHVIFAGFTHEPAIRLSENLLSILPGKMSHIFFSDNGSTAVEVGLKMAIQYWNNLGQTKRKIIAMEGAYHGDTFGAMSVGDRGLFTKPFFDYLFDVDFIPFPDETNSDEVVRRFEELTQAQDVAAFIFEPLVQGAAGMRIYAPALLDKLLAIARKYHVLSIADEVFTGFGRTGKLFACDYLQHKPDIITVSKGITGGTLPLGVTACNEKILSAFQSGDFTRTFFHGHSYTANPLACAVANASFELLMDDSCVKSIHRISQQHEKFRMSIEDHPNVRHIRSLGTIIALEVETATGTSYDNEIRKKIFPYFIEKGILLRPMGNVIYILPPYVITNEELERIYTAIETFLGEIDTL